MKVSFNIKGMLAAIAVAVAPTMLTSCNDLLDMPSYTDNDIDFVFGNKVSVEAYVKGCYRGLITLEQYYQMNAGETITLPSEEDLDGSKFFIANYKYDPNAGPYTLSTTYKESYSIIENCNVGIRYISQSKDFDGKNALLAELYFIRAYCYHNLIRFYGDVPAVFIDYAAADPNDHNTLYPPRASRDEIYDRIIGEMQEYVDYLPWYEESGYGVPTRISRQAGKGILARICLYAGGYSLRWGLNEGDPTTPTLCRRADSDRVKELYTIADSALGEVINHGWNHLLQATNGMDGFQYLFFNYCQRNFGITEPEMMWQIGCYGEKTNSKFGVWNGQPGSMGGFYGQRKALQLKFPTYYLSFNEGDVRRDVSCCNYSVTFVNENKIDDKWANIGTGYSSVGSGKFRIQWCVEPYDADARNIDIPVLRYADILLMRAETQNFLFHGPTGEAISYLKLVRERAGVGDLTYSGSEEGFLDDIMQERKWEFADEFMLRTDLIRTDLLDKNLKACREEMKTLARGEDPRAAKYRIYRFTLNAQKYGDPFLKLDYVDVTDQAEIDLIKTSPANKNAYAQSLANALKVAKAHGFEDDGNPWYATNMMQEWGSTYNQRWRQAAGFNPAACSQINLGQSLYTRKTQWSNGVYPDWIDGPKGLFFAYEKNKTELLPLANISVGHPMVDNPSLTQLPGYE